MSQDTSNTAQILKETAFVTAAGAKQVGKNLLRNLGLSIAAVVLYVVVFVEIVTLGAFGVIETAGAAFTFFFFFLVMPFIVFIVSWLIFGRVFRQRSEEKVREAMMREDDRQYVLSQQKKFYQQQPQRARAVGTFRVDDDN